MYHELRLGLSKLLPLGIVFPVPFSLAPALPEAVVFVAVEPDLTLRELEVAVGLGCGVAITFESSAALVFDTDLSEDGGEEPGNRDGDGDSFWRFA